MEKRVLILLTLFCFGLTVFSGAAGRSRLKQGSVPAAQVEKTEEVEETIVPGPKDIKQETSLYVFIGWLWLCIGVCVYFLRLKIKEADRLLLLDYFSRDKH